MKKRSRKPVKPESDEDELEMQSDGSDFDDDWDLSRVASVSNAKRELPNDEVIESIPKKKKKLNNDLYKAPTVEEINQLKETESLFHSNLFRLQFEEILSEVKFKDKYKKLFQTWLPKFKKQIESIEETKEYKLFDEELLQNLDAKIPIVKLPQDTKGTFKFLKPSNISVIGSYALDATIGPNIIIDLAVEMPERLFQKGDYQNYRYLRKRAIYLSHIVSNIDNDLTQEKSFVGNNEKVILKLVPTGKLGKKCIIYVHLAAQESSFKLNRFLPEKNSIRPGWFFMKEFREDESLIPTPHYNSVVLHDLTMLRTNEQNVKLIKEYPNIRDGIILLKIWLSQRELNKGFNAFNGHVMAMYVLYLLRTKKLNTFMSSYQIVRNVWNGLAQSNWSESGISLCQEAESLNRVFEYQKHYDCVFLDITGYHNIAANISKEMFAWIRDLAAASVKSLDNGQIDNFQILFMRKVPIYRAFDNLLCIHDTFAMKKIVQKTSAEVDQLNFGPNKHLQSVKLIVNVLKQGLGQRLLDIFVLPEQFKEWNITDDVPEDLDKIFVGLNLNPNFYFDVITKGPEGNSPKAATFRKFWGEKSELHRFKDGSIHEVVVWGEGKSLEEKRSLTKKIVLFVLQKKLSLHRSKIFYLGNQMENLLKLQKIKVTNFEYGTGEEASLRVIQIFNSLEKELTNLTDMPLSITGIQGSSSVLRYTEVFPPLATVIREEENITFEGEKYLFLVKENLKKAPTYVQPIEITIQLLTSGKWPDELEAIQITKGAFQIQVAECLRKQYKLKAQGSLHYTDVFKNGFVFRLRIAHQKEIALMKQQIGDDGVVKYRDTDESIALEKKLFHLPKINGALHGLHCQQTSFGPACCLAKRWLSSQLLDDSHFPDIVVELLLASIYLTPDPYKPAQMPQVAFFRLLEMFARCHWSSNPFIVNFNNEMTREQIVAVENLFGTSRESLPPLFISTPYDQESSMWTKKAPTLVILNRVCLLAKEALKLIEAQVLNSALDYKTIFRPPLSEYDCLIHLKSTYNPRRYEAIEVDENEPIVDWHPFKYHSKHRIPVVDFNPIQLYLKELRKNYGEFALFFHNTYGGEIIGVLLKPSVLEPKEDVKVANFYCRKLNSKGQFVLDTSTMIENFYIIGKDIISEIEVQSKRISIN